MEDNGIVGIVMSVIFWGIIAFFGLIPILGIYYWIRGDLKDKAIDSDEFNRLKSGGGHFRLSLPGIETSTANDVKEALAKYNTYEVTLGYIKYIYNNRSVASKEVVQAVLDFWLQQVKEEPRYYIKYDYSDMLINHRGILRGLNVFICSPFFYEDDDDEDEEYYDEREDEDEEVDPIYYYIQETGANRSFSLFGDTRIDIVVEPLCSDNIFDSSEELRNLHPDRITLNSSEFVHYVTEKILRAILEDKI